MSAPDSRTQEYLVRARELVAQIEAGNTERADELLDALSGLRESKLFQDLGKLTRTLHEAISNFQLEPRLSSLVREHIPDARDRLRYVVTKTEESPNRPPK